MGSGPCRGASGGGAAVRVEPGAARPTRGPNKVSLSSAVTVLGDEEKRPLRGLRDETRPEEIFLHGDLSAQSPFSSVISFLIKMENVPSLTSSNLQEPRKKAAKISPRGDKTNLAHTPDTDGISTSAEQLELCGQRGQDGDASSHFRLWARAFRRHEARERARRAGPLWHYQSRREVLLERLPRTYPIRTRRCRYAPPSGLSDGKTLVCAVQLFATASSASVRNNCLWAHQRRLVPRAAAPPRIVCSRASLPLRPSHEVTQRAAVNGRRQGGG